MSPITRAKYTVRSRDKLLYQRAYPTRLLAHPALDGKKNYVRSMGVSVSDHESKILEAHRLHSDAYDSYIRSLSLADSEALSAAESLRVAKGLLVSAGLEEGYLADNPLLTPEQNKAVHEARYEEVRSSGVVAATLTAIEGTELTPEGSLAESAWKLLTEPPTAKLSSVMLLSELYAPYQTHRGTTGRAEKRERRRYEVFLEIAGDTVLDQESVHKALDRYADKRQEQVSSASLKRELAMILACIRFTVKKHRLPIALSPPIIREGKPKPRRVLSDDEGKELLSLIAKPPVQGTWKEMAILLMLQTGCITTELQRLKADSLNLEAEIPYLHIYGETKTSSRERYVPLTVQVDRLRELKSELSDSEADSHGNTFALGKVFSGMDDSNVSHQLITVIRKVAPEAVAYSMRHTMKANGLARGIDTHSLALIGGWSGLVSSVMLGYGADSYASGPVMERLKGDLLKINSHLL